MFGVEERQTSQLGGRSPWAIITQARVCLWLRSPQSQFLFSFTYSGLLNSAMGVEPLYTGGTCISLSSLRSNIIAPRLTTSPGYHFLFRSAGYRILLTSSWASQTKTACPTSRTTTKNTHSPTTRSRASAAPHHTLVGPAPSRVGTVRAERRAQGPEEAQTVYEDGGAAFS